MSILITKKCINCSICELECPNHAIKLIGKFYKIDKKNCTECVGYYKEPRCKKVCPIKNAIIKK